MRLDAEYVILNQSQVDCGVQEELWEAPPPLKGIVGERASARLTDKGRSLYPVLISLALWGQDNAPTSGPKSHLVDRAQEQPVRSVDVIASDGRILKPGETKMVRAA